MIGTFFCAVQSSPKMIADRLHGDLHGEFILSDSSLASSKKPGFLLSTAQRKLVNPSIDFFLIAIVTLQCHENYVYRARAHEREREREKETQTIKVTVIKSIVSIVRSSPFP